MNQDNWRLCRKCKGLFLASGGASKCPAGAQHDGTGSPDYVLSDGGLNLPIEATLSGYEEWVGLSIAVPTGGNIGINVVSKGTSSQDGVNPQGVYAETDGFGTSFYGVARQGSGVIGEADDGTGVYGTSKAGRGVWGASAGAADGVSGFSQSGTGVFGEGPGNGVHGKSAAGRAVYGENTAAGDGVGGFSQSGTGVAGVSQSGSGVYGRSRTGMAGFFDGNIKVTGEIRMEGADFAEEFEVPEGIPAGTVMIVDEAGELAISRMPYDKRVVGVIAGAGSYRPGLILDSRREDVPESSRRAISLMGKTYCRADASGGAIGVGDLLTTAAVPGCAMRATERDRAFGAVLGKALAPLAEGTGLIPILVALQ